MDIVVSFRILVLVAVRPAISASPLNSLELYVLRESPYNSCGINTSYLSFFTLCRIETQVQEICHRDVNSQLEAEWGP